MGSEPAASSMGREPIAIIGLSCKFSGDATNPDKLWTLLEEGRSAWSEIPSSRFNPKGAYHPSREKLSTSHIRGGHFIDEDLALFDAAFFNFSTEVASTLDPQFRLQLESVYEALENAGLPLSKVAGTNTSVFGGTFFHDYRDALVRDEDNLPRSFITGIGSAMASNRISHFFDLRGASMTIDTGCSTTLVALAQAVENLRSRASDMSIVSGANVLLNADNFKALGSFGFLSPDGKCFAFDHRGNGYGRGEGVATIVLKPLKDALAAGDPVRAIIREAVLNQDGKTETITSPSQEAQESLMRDCYAKAGLDPAWTQYFEAHGTGTATGDPIEAGAILSAFQSQRRSKEQALRIGSVKTNIGHTEAASGLASIIKVVLAMEKGILPPSINFEKPNPKLDLDNWGLKVVRELEKWPVAPGQKMRASVNNFGYGGANAHVIMEDASGLSQIHRVNGHTNGVNGHANGINGKTNGVNGHITENTVDKYKLLILSAKDEHAHENMASRLAEFLRQKEQHSQQEVEAYLDNMFYTLTDRRTMFPWLAAFPVPVTQGFEGVAKALSTPKFRPSRPSQRPRIGMVFTGQGAQWNAMGRELIGQYPVFKASLEQADGLLRELGADWSLMEELSRDAKTSRVNQTAFSIPICAAVQIALIRLLETWGVTPSAVTSHSSGEIAAAYAVGAISLRLAMGIAYYRSMMAAEMTKGGPIKGGMLAVGLGHVEVEPYLKRLTCGARVGVACINSPSSTTMAGDVEAVEELEGLLKADDIFARRLRVDTAYHSHHMEPVADSYRKALRAMPKEMPRTNGLATIAFASPVTGYRISSAKKIADPEHWVGSLLQPVQFVEAFTEMVQGDLSDDAPPSSVDIIVEVGPHTALGGPIQEILAMDDFDGLKLPYYGTLVRHGHAVESLQTLASNLLKEGYPVDVEAVNFPEGKGGDVRVLTDLPSYPWNHQTKHWHEPRFNLGYRQRDQAPHELLGSLVPGSNPDAPVWRNIVRVTDFPWVQDHAIQGMMLYPGCGFICLAIEAIKQQLAIAEEQEEREIFGFQVQDVSVLQALVIPDTADGVEIQTTLRPASDKAVGLQGWTEFEVFSVTSENRWMKHAQGLIMVEFDKVDHSLSPADVEIRNGRQVDVVDMWSTLESLGIKYGPTFRNISDIRQSKKELRSTSTITVPDTSVPIDLPRNHVIHPATFDALAQAAFTALPGTAYYQESPRVFQSIERLWISSRISAETGTAFQCHTKLDYADVQGVKAGVVLVDQTGPVVKLSGLQLRSLGGGGTESSQGGLCSTLSWESDIDLNLGSDIKKSGGDGAALLRQIAHKQPRARILEIGASLNGTTRAMLEALGQLGSVYHFTNTSDEDFEKAEKDLSAWGEILMFDTLDVAKDLSAQGFEPASYDVVIASGIVPSSTQTLAAAQALIKPGGKLLLAQTASDGLDKLLKDAGFSGVDIAVTGSAVLSTVPPTDPIQLPRSDEIILVTSSKTGVPPAKWLKSLQDLVSKLVPDAASSSLPEVHDLEATSEESYSGKICIFLGEISKPVLRDVDAKAFEAIKAMTTKCKGLLWVTRGGSVKCEAPDFGLAAGFLRTARSEYLGRAYVALDFDPSAPLWSDNDAQAIVKVLRAGFDSSSPGEFEYAVRDGVFKVPRVFDDAPRNRLVSPSDTLAANAVALAPLRQADRALSLHIGAPGRLETLVFAEDAPLSGAGELSPELVEIEPHAYGLNDRDLMIATGQLHGEPMGVEGAGIITRVGAEAAKKGYTVGDKVFGLLPHGKIGSIARVPWTSVVKMLPSHGFEEAAALPIAYCTAYMSLTTLAHLEKDQAVLIHDAAGSVGQAAIMIARHVGAKIFATVATPEDRELMTTHYGIPADHVFSSQDSSFVAGVLTSTKNSGVDVVLNTLSGPLVQENFNVLAAFGHLIDISQQDSEAKNQLAARPSNRPVSVSAFSLLALAQHSPCQLHRALVETAKLIREHKLLPAQPLASYSVSEVSEAFRHLQTAGTVGKTVLSVGSDVKVPVLRRSLTPKFKSDASYLLVGGVGGIGLSMAHWMADQGAKNIIVLSRSAGRSEQAAALAKELSKEGCRVKAVSCDVSSEASLADALGQCKKDGLPPVRGVIQGAMVLKDTLLERMTLADYQTAIHPKVHGTWNLHSQFSKKDSLDFFVMLSSAVAVAGNASQANYAAGGTFQDALAHLRVSQGLPGVSINLGAVKGIGVAESHGVLGHLARVGYAPINEEQVLAIISTTILQPHDPQVVVGLDSRPGSHWDAKGESQLGRDMRFAALKPREIDTAGANAAAGANSLASKLTSSDSVEQAADHVGTAMAEKISNIFMIPLDEVDLANKPAHYGIDSLVAVELRNMLVQQAAAEVSIFDIMQSVSLAALAAGVAAKSAYLSVVQAS